MLKNQTVIEASNSDIIDSRWRQALLIVYLSIIVAMIFVVSVDRKLAVQSAPNPIAINRQDDSSRVASPARELSWEPMIFDELSDLIPIPSAPGRFAGINPNDEVSAENPHSSQIRIE